MFYYDIESRLETCYECKVEQPELFDELGNMVSGRKQLRKTFFVSSQSEVDEFKLNLTPRELCLLNVSKCQSHQPTLLCIVNESGSVKRDFCERDLHGYDPILSFFRWVVDEVVKPTNSSKNEKNDYVFVAHNGSAYDTQFIYKTAHKLFGHRNVNALLHMNRMIELKIQIHTGFRLSSIFFKDSYKFINLPLRLLPKSFGFHNDLQKGFFPHLLNTSNNMDYVSDSLPDIEEFGVNEMSEEEQCRFLEWYKNESDELVRSGRSYELRNEMKKYCYDDCNVLATAFGRFNESMISELVRSNMVGIVPHQYTILADFITLPQLVIHWYVGTSVPERTLAMVPHGGYDGSKCGSLKENLWLTYLDKLYEQDERLDFVPIRSRYCSGLTQKTVGRYHLDGFRILNDGSKECYEFYGCYYHGCPICFLNWSKVVRRKHRENGFHTVEAAYQATVLR